MRAEQLRRMLLCGAALAAGLAVAGTPSARAQDALPAFSLPAQPLSGALKAYGKAAGRQLIFSEDLVRGRQAPAVQGAMPPDVALERLLAGTDLTYVRARSGGYMIVRRETAGPQRLAAAENASVEAASVEELVVTGTRIQGAAPVGSKPVVLTREEIVASGRSSAADLLRLLPENSALGTGEEARRGVQVGPPNVTFAAAANLRGLGADATLTLLNGHRAASTAEGGLVDISQIPLLAVERVEVLADGASAIYGSDAVAGVVNFIFRKGFDGAETQVRYGAGDGFDQIIVSQALGRQWSSGGVFAAVEYLDHAALSARDRDYFTNDLRAFGGPDLRTNNGIPGTLSVGGTTYALPAGQNGRSLTAAQLTPGTSNRRNRWADADILPSSEKWSGVINFHQELAPGLTLVFDAIATHRESVRRDTGIETSLTVPRANPFFVSPVPNAQSVTVLYNWANDYGPATLAAVAEDLTFHGGFELDLPGDWQGSLTGLTSRTRADSYYDNIGNSTRVAEALRDPNPATAFNPFGDRGSNSPEVLERIRGFVSSYRNHSLNSVNVEASGSVLELPAGPLRLALGAETRKERMSVFDPIFVSGAAPSVPTNLRLARRVDAVFAEALLPVLPAEGLAGFGGALTVSAAVRGERYSDIGDTWNPKLGFEWAAAEGLTVRGTWGTSFKAPRLPQMLTTQNNIFTTNYVLPSGPVTVIQLSGTSEALAPEEAETFTLGFDYRPAWLDGLRVSATWFDVNYTDRILRPTSGEIITALGSEAANALVLSRRPSVSEVQAYYANPLFSPTAARPDPSTIFAVVDFRFANLGRVEQSGFDVRLNYRAETDVGELGIDAAVTYVTDYRTTRVRGGESLDGLNTTNNPIDLRARVQAQWARGGWRAAVAANHVGDYVNTTIAPFQDVKAWTTWDAQLSYSPELPAVGEVGVILDVRNVLDEDPPRVANVSAGLGYDAEQANALGRVVSLTLLKRW